jgi:hypothetical protein
MTIPGLARITLTVALAALVAGCGGSNPGRPIGRTLEVLPTDGALTDATRFYRTMGLASAHSPVSFVGKVAYFASPTPDTAIMLVSVSIPTRSLGFAREGDVYRAQYGVQLKLSRGAEEVQRIEAT